MAWVFLVLAGLLEIGWAVSLKLSDGLSRPLPSVAALVLMAGSVVLLALALRALPVGTAYAAWTGIGAIGVAIVGVLLLGEPITLLRSVAIFLILAGIVGLRLGHPS